MSRHSKNNTASSIFTHGERLRLQEWGTIKQRVGKDSQKEFSQCELCLSHVVEPLACCKGHIFCRMCIIENLVSQKKQRDGLIKRWDKEEEQRQTASRQVHEQQVLSRIEKFEKVELTVPESRVTGKEVRLMEQVTDEKEREKVRFIEKVIEDKRAVTTLEDKREEEKKEWIQASFWAPDNTPMVENKTLEKEPSKKLYCPAVQTDDKEGAHQVKLKELVALKLNENDGEYVCWVCQKALVHQKISLLRKCGHVMCKECVNKFCYNRPTDQTGRCSKCDKEFQRGHKDVIALHESGSAFASHSKVEAMLVKPTFQS